MPVDALAADSVRCAARYHDEVAQALVAARMQLTLLADDLGPGEPPEAFRSACAALDAAIVAARRWMAECDSPPASGKA